MSKKNKVIEGQQAFLKEGTLDLFIDWISNFTEVPQADPVEFDDDWDAPVLKKPKKYQVYESIDGKTRMTWAERGYIPVKVEKLKDGIWETVFDKTDED